MDKALILNKFLEKFKSLDIKYDFVTFPLYIISSPFKGFYEMKHEKKGRLYFGFVMLLLMCMLGLLQTTHTGFIVSEFYSESPVVNIPYVITMQVAPVILFVVANWSITSITDGKGKMVEIFMTYSYAAYPQIILGFIGLVMTNIVTTEEAAFATFFYVFGTVIFLLYLFVGLIIVHEYTFFKAVTMVILTILSMLLIIFILALLTSLSSEVINFFYTVYTELIMKL